VVLLVNMVNAIPLKRLTRLLTIPVVGCRRRVVVNPSSATTNLVKPVKVLHEAVKVMVKQISRHIRQAIRVKSCSGWQLLHLALTLTSAAATATVGPSVLH
jgi:hypothetical protein